LAAREFRKMWRYFDSVATTAEKKGDSSDEQSSKYEQEK